MFLKLIEEAKKGLEEVTLLTRKFEKLKERVNSEEFTDLLDDLEKSRAGFSLVITGYHPERGAKPVRYMDLMIEELKK